MPEFEYRAITTRGQPKTGKEYADTRLELERRLRSRQLILLDCQIVLVRHISWKIVGNFLGQLASLMGNGISVDRAIRIIAEDTVDSKLKKFSNDVRDQVKQGVPLSQALAVVGNVDILVVTMIHAGEVSGTLSDVLIRLQKYESQRQKTQQELIGAITYPAILVVVSILSVVMITIFAVPAFRDIFRDRENVLPSSTRMIFMFSDILTNYGWHFIIVCFFAFVSVCYIYRRSTSLKLFIHDKLLQTPWLGGLIGRIEAARIFTVLGTLLLEGVPLMQSMDIITSVPRNLRIRNALVRAHIGVKKGEPLSTAFADIPNMPRRVRTLLAIGGETGRLGLMSAKIGSDIHDELSAQTKIMVAMIEPIVILLMGGVIGFIVISMLLGVYSISDF